MLKRIHLHSRATLNQHLIIPFRHRQRRKQKKLGTLEAYPQENECSKMAYENIYACLLSIYIAIIESLTVLLEGINLTDTLDNTIKKLWRGSVESYHEHWGYIHALQFLVSLH